MRILLSEKGRKDLFNLLKKENNVKNLKELSNKLKIPYKTLQKWRYGHRLLPDFMISKSSGNLKIIEKKEETWGQSKGGKIACKKKYKPS